MIRAILITLILRVVLIVTVSCTRADYYNPHKIMEDMLSDYTYMSFGEELNNPAVMEWHVMNWKFSCEKLWSMTKKWSISEDMCLRVFLFYYGLDD